MTITAAPQLYHEARQREAEEAWRYFIGDAAGNRCPCCGSEEPGDRTYASVSRHTYGCRRCWRVDNAQAWRRAYLDALRERVLAGPFGQALADFERMRRALSDSMLDTIEFHRRARRMWQALEERYFGHATSRAFRGPAIVYPSAL